MQKVSGFLALLVAVLFGGVALAQEQTRTQEELAKLPMYDRLLKGDDAQKAAELETSHDEAIKSENWAAAQTFAQELLDLRIANQGADHYEVTDARFAVEKVGIIATLTPDARQQITEANQQEQQVADLYQQNQFQKAAELEERVLALRKKLLGQNHPDYDSTLNRLCEVYRSMGDFTKAEPLFVEALNLRHKLLGENHPNYASSLNNFGLLYNSIGEYNKAEPLLVQSRDLFKKLLGENHPNYANSLNSLANLYYSMGEYGKAEPLLLQARDLSRQFLGDEHLDYALCLNNLAELYRKMGKYRNAEPPQLRARDLFKKLLGESHPYYATSLNNLGALYFEMGEFAKAEAMLVQTRELFQMLLGENHQSYAACLNNLAGLYQAIGEYAKAEQLYSQARDLFKKLSGENHPEYATSVMGLATVVYQMEKYAEAELLYAQSLDIFRIQLGEKHPLYATNLNNLAAMYESTGEYGKAEPLYQKALDLRKQMLGENHPDYATSLNNLASLYKSLGENIRAKPLFLQTRDLCKNLLGENHPTYAAILNNLAGLYYATGEYSKAEPLLLECTRSYEMSRISRAAGFRRAVGGEGENPYFFLANLSAKLEKPRQGFDALELNLARAYLDVQAERRDQILTADQQFRQSSIFNDLLPIEERIAVLVDRVKQTDEEARELVEKIAARSQLNLALSELAAELSTQELSDFTQIQQVIPVGHALIAWVDVEIGQGQGQAQESWACLLASDGEPFWVPLPGSGENGKWTKEDSQLTSKLRDALAQPVPPSNLPELIEQLRHQRIEPVLDHLKEHGITQLYVVGVDQMAGLPVEVIAPEFTVSYVPSGTFLARLPEKPKFENTLFAVGDPIYEIEKAKQQELTALPSHGLLIDALAPGGKAEELGLSPGQVLLQYDDVNLTSIDDLKAAVQKASEAGAKTAAVTVWSVDDVDKPSEQVVEFPVGPLGVILAPDPAPAALVSRRKGEAVFASISRGEEWSDLPGTRYEIEQLRKLFPTSTVLFDSKATEAAVDALRQTDDLSQFRYLHFATHGKGNSVTAFESKLILSQDQPKGEIKAGEPWINNEISAREVLDYWKLNADLVTLSACQTGLGRQGGGEGLLGFAQAFLLSGSRSVCLSLWEVDDIATALLMQRFYQNLLGQREGLTAPMPKAKALAEAKHWLRNLTAAEATALTAQLTGGIARGTRQEKTFKVPPPSTSAEIAAGDDYKPYARPHYWAAFILIGDPE